MEDTAKYEVDMAEFDENEPADEKLVLLEDKEYRHMQQRIQELEEQTDSLLSLAKDRRERIQELEEALRVINSHNKTCIKSGIIQEIIKSALGTP
jgi:DNA-binding protein H-NS